MKKNLEKYLVRPGMKVLDAIRVIDITKDQFAVVVNDDMQLLGVVSDGDIRRYILQGKSLELPVGEMMNTSPVIVTPDCKLDLEAISRTRRIHLFPSVDSNNRLVDIISIGALSQNKPNLVVLMAGGMGKRLRPLTDNLPKPMLKIGDRPILESIIMKFAEQGFVNFRVSVNYMAQMIIDHFGDGSKWGVNIQYLHEEKQMGTAGSLSLLNESMDEPILVMNGDVLTKINFDHALHFHHDHEADATMCVRQFDFQVPYGVVNIDEETQSIAAIDEKPTHSFFVNAGIYILNPEVLELIKAESYLDMPNLFEMIKKTGKKSVPFPVREYWVDIGQVDQYDRACIEFGDIFDSTNPSKEIN